ncbi:unnamed protein product, partial [marine sediment metagenome]
MKRDKMAGTKAEVKVKWTVLFRAKGVGKKQRLKRFEAGESFVKAKV